MTAPAQQGRGRAVGALLFVLIVVLVLGAGLGYLVFRSTDGDDTPVATPTSPAARGNTSATPGDAETIARQDALAAKPMLQLPTSAAQPQPLVSETAGPPISVPAPRTKIKPGGPPFVTGFAQTPQGALGQLAAIDEAALSTTDPARAHEVYKWAALPGAVDETEWSPAFAVRRLVDSLGGPEKAATAHVNYKVVQGQVKGTVGKSFVVACVLGEYDASLNTSVRIGLGDCQRMVWHDGRWRIGPGAQPAWAPSAWPGSADAVRGGWRELKRATDS